jgi:hypothetical protein
MHASTAAEAQTRKVPTKLDGGHTSNYFGSKDEASGPHAFLVEGGPGYRIEPHFHGVNQFQVCVGGSGRLMKKALAPGVLHYADAYTPYGPIVASEQGLSFFTLREKAYAFGAHYVPGSKEEKKAPTGRNLITQAEVAGERSTGVRPLFEEQDGVGAYELRAAPNAPVPDPAQLPERGAAYIVVFTGAVTAAGKEYGERSCLFVGAGEPAPAMVAGRDGAVVGFLQFARAKEQPSA